MCFFFQEHQHSTEAQYSFLKSKSAEQAIDITDKMVEKEQLFAVGLFLYLRTAFDTAQHNILVQKFEIHDAREVAVRLVNRYLTRHYQYALINGHSSNKEKNTTLCSSSLHSRTSIISRLHYWYYRNTRFLWITYALRWHELLAWRKVRRKVG